MDDRRHDRAAEELEQLRAALDASPDLFYLVDIAEDRFLFVNETACRLEGCTREEHLRMTPWDAARMTKEQMHALHEQAMAQPGRLLTQEVLAERAGQRGWFEVRRRAVQVGGRWLLVAVAREVTERKLSERSAVRLGHMYAALGATNEAILHSGTAEELYQRVCDAAVHGGRLVSAAVMLPAEGGGAEIAAVTGSGERYLRTPHATFAEGTAYGDGLVGTAFRTARPCISDDFLADERTRPWHAMAREAGVRSSAAVPILRDGRAAGVMLFHAGERRSFDAAATALLERMAANVTFALENFEREAARRRAAEDIEHLATHDSLTGLPNREMFNQLLAVEIRAARRHSAGFAVLFVDLDRFKFVNDTLGHPAGDALLMEMAGRFKAALRASDVVARVGGDEFVVLARDAADIGQVAVVARKLLSAAIRPVEVGGHDCRVTASIGVSLFPADAEDEAGLLKNADLAMYLAKEAGKNNYQFYSPEIRTRSMERMALETRLGHALRRGELSLQYLAKLDLQTEAITGVEALLRWTNAELGPVSPAQFIPVAEDSGLIIPIGRWVLATACAQNVAWQRQGLPPICVAVNLSPRQFADPDLVADVKAVLQETGMAPHLLELEVGETMVTQDVTRSVRILSAVKELGVRLAIDDFGTAYSSLAQLSRFPIDTIKVDRSFIRQLPTDAEDTATTEAIIAMGRSLSLTVVAEGVENEQQRRFLREHACHEIQGFYFSRPVAPDAFADLLRQHSRGTAS